MNFDQDRNPVQMPKISCRRRNKQSSVVFEGNDEAPQAAKTLSMMFSHTDEEKAELDMIGGAEHQNDDGVDLNYSSSSSDDQQLPPQFQKRNSEASELAQSVLSVQSVKSQVLPSIIKYKKQMKRQRERQARHAEKEAEKKRQQINRFYGRVDKDNGFILNNSEPDSLKQRMQSKDFMDAANGVGRSRTDSSVQSLYIMEEIDETESEDENEEPISDEDEVIQRLDTLKGNQTQKTCLGNHWRDRGDYFSSSSSESSDDARKDALTKRIKKKKEEKKVTTRKEEKKPKGGVLSSGKKDNCIKSLGDQLKEISQKINKTSGLNSGQALKKATQQSKKTVKYKQNPYDEDENEIDLEGVCVQDRRKSTSVNQIDQIDEEDDLDPLSYITINDSDSDTREQLLNTYKEQITDVSLAAKQREEIMQMHLRQQELERQRLLVRRRFEERQRIDELLLSLLSGALFSQFTDMKPSDFDNCILPLEFKSHHEYREMWEKLYFYEVYCLLLNSQRRSDIEEQQLRAAARDKGLSTEAFRRPRRAMKWKGYVQTSTSESYFQHIKMYDVPPVIPEEGEEKDKDKKSKPKQSWISQVSPGFSIRQMKEFDLVILCEEELDLSGQDDVKSMCNASFMISLLQRTNAMLGYVIKRAVPTRGQMGGAKLLVHNPKSFFLEHAESESGYATLHCYFYENISTIVREYKTLRVSEFLRMTPLILWPSQTAKMDRMNRDKLLKDSAKELEIAVNKAHLFGVPKEEEFIPMRHAKNVVQEVDPRVKMRWYADRNRKLFNPSQLIVLDKVIDMLENDIMLIQGPPGTGKTHTITGIISMLLDSGAKKVMVCAPSNAAIDEIVSRIANNGFIGRPQKGDMNSILGNENASAADGLLLRIGAADYEPSPEVKRHTLDQRLTDTLCGKRVFTLRQKIDCCQELLSILKQTANVNEGQGQLLTGSRHQVECVMTIFNTTNSVDAKKFMKQQTKEHQLNTITKYKSKAESDLSEILSGENQKQGQDWKLVETQLLQKSQIICCTLSLAGQDKLDSLKNCIDYLIVDEACQCIEPATLIPFELGPKKVILVGDQRQLPATTFSENAKVSNFSRSLFERLLLAGYDKTMLEIQYRMHPSISKFPASQFYENKIQDHYSIIRRQLTPALSTIWEQIGNRVVFFDIVDSRETIEEKSKSNKNEAEFSKALIANLIDSVGSIKELKGLIGIISPYKSQVRLIKSKLDPLCRYHQSPMNETIEINTVDAFQGREKDIIIFNCVRSNSHVNVQSSLGFLIDERRLNVAITRPRHFLIIIGNANTLVKSDTWRDLINHCKDSQTFVPVKVSELSDEQFGIPGVLLRAKANGPKLEKNDSHKRGLSTHLSFEQQTRPTSTQIEQIFPEDCMKSQLVKELYKGAMTQQQCQELDELVNEQKYLDLKRQKR